MTDCWGFYFWYLMKTIFVTLAAIILLFGYSCSQQTDEIADLADRVANLDVHRNDYTLGKVLTDKQKKTAQANVLDAPSPGTYKFKDNDLHVVADQVSDRVLVIYERYEPATREKIQELVGALFFDFGEPTVMAHDKTIYWTFDEKGKISEKQYLDAKNSKNPLKPLATVKLNSSQKIMENDGPVENGSVYYIISSDPISKLIRAREK